MLVLDDDRVDVVRDVPHLRAQVAVVEMAHADEGHVVAGGPQAVRERERVVMDAAALIAREDGELARPPLRESPARERERVAQPFRDAVGGELRETGASLLDEASAQLPVTDDALERLRHAVRRLVLEQHAGVAERIGDRARGVRDDRQIAAYRLEERHAEALVLR